MGPPVVQPMKILVGVAVGSVLVFALFYLMGLWAGVVR